MCGIVAYAGNKEAGEVLLSGLKKLEYRGYDSAGLAVLNGGDIGLLRSVGKLGALEEKFKAAPLKGSVGIGHTRWATHGRPTELNAHPHVEGSIAVVHNGIIENYLKLREELIKEGRVFKSETDTEITAHLIDREIKKGASLKEALSKALKYVEGSYALVAINKDEPGLVVGARKECPLVVGFSEGQAIIASDVLAVLNITNDVIFLDDGEFVSITDNKVEITDIEGKVALKETKHIDWSSDMAEKGGYDHFMLKEIFEQPEAITDTFRGLLIEEDGDVFFNDFSIELKGIERIYIIACGTSWHAALVGKFLFEELIGIPTEVDIASEFRYREPLLDEKSLVVAISQSGETADTLAAVGEVKKRGAQVIAICNVLESSLTREADWTLMTHAGPEIGVASTKAFTTQLVALYILAIYMGRRLAKLTSEKGREYIQDLLELPSKVERTLRMDSHIKELAKDYFDNTDFLYLGRSINYPIALEGALKLKEISYIHAEGYPAGEMKHGPIALIEDGLPVVMIAPDDKSYVKMLSNMEEVKARDGRVVAIVNKGKSEAVERADDIIEVPHSTRHLSPVIMAIPLQLLAYHIAVLKGTDVDQPRNLAKSVTVE
ncbi:MAG: glutamine--fructose-6-phosphate transaminase (isomerizing) [Proteobacteria bacterium]|nr:glutamine--fructose-6-phosphate transaminase (isomerizing) [Pseudomonadota bacterium]